MRHVGWLSLISLLVLSAGCGIRGEIRRGVNFYMTSHYPEALVVWQDLECCEHEMNHKATVRYLVYRGLTHYRLGQRDTARFYLLRGEQAYLSGSRRWLPPIVVRELHAALVHLRGKKKSKR